MAKTSDLFNPVEKVSKNHQAKMNLICPDKLLGIKYSLTHINQSEILALIQTGGQTAFLLYT